MLRFECRLRIRFSLYPPNLFTCNKQWLNSVFLSFLLKLWVLVLNFKCPNKCVFLPFYGLICENLEFPSAKSSNIFTAHRILQDTNFKDEKSRVCKGRFFDFRKYMSFTAAKLVLEISLKNEFRLKWHIYYQSSKFHGISPKETRENSLSVLLFVLMST